LSCWDCKYQKLGGITLLGYCLYWERLDKPIKEIPPNIVDKGCKFETQEEKEVIEQMSLF
tara:strand:- start:418 stop:597 length:180 start_codon:yes stop_codon:yes gene_type:complete